MNKEPIMVDPDAVMEADAYRNSLNNMHARIRKFLRQHPDTDNAEELTNTYKRLSRAYNDAFFHCDKDHFDRWEQLLKQSKESLKKAGTNGTELTYKGYTAAMFCYQDYVEGGTMFHGKVNVTDAMITFWGKTMEEAEQDFHDAIDGFLFHRFFKKKKR